MLLLFDVLVLLAFALLGWEGDALPFLDSESPICQDRDECIEDNECPEDTIVSPLRAPVDIGLRGELIGVTQRAVLAVDSGVWILQSSRCNLQIRCKIFSASLTGGWAEDGYLSWRTVDWTLVDLRCDDARNPISEAR